MPLLNAGSLFELISSYRLVWISGRFGGGKTSLAYVIAEHFLRRDYALITNNKTVWADDMAQVHLDAAGKLRAVVLLDEGGLYFKQSAQIEQICAYAAKMDCIYLLPSFFPPTRAAQVLTIQPLFSLMAAGIPLIMYRWRVHLGAWNDVGSFGWFYPRAIYGVYSRNDPGSDPVSIVNWLVGKMTEFRGMYGHGDALQDSTGGGDEASIVNALQDVSQGLSDTSDTIAASVSQRGRGSKKYKS